MYELNQSPLNFTLDLTESQITGNTVGITSTTFAFSQEQTTYLTTNTKTLVYKWTSSGSPGVRSYYLGLFSADEQTYSNQQYPFTFTLVEPPPAP